MPNYKKRSGIYLQPEASTTPVTSDAEATFGATSNLIISESVTLPTTEEFYFITAIECENGATVSGNVQLLVILVDADPPVRQEIQVIAYTPITAQAGTSATQKIATQSTLLVKGGTVITPGQIIDNATGVIQYDTVSSENTYKASFLTRAIQIPFNDSIAWSAGTAHPRLKIYYRGYST